MRWYYRKLSDGLVITHTRPEHAAQLEELQRICFPTLAEDERFKQRHFLKHIELFDEGQFVALDEDRVVGATTTLRLDFDLNHVDHTFAEIIQGGWLTSHQPEGDWLYGADLSVRPEYRGRGLATALYAARQEVVWRLKLKGQVTAGMIPGYGPLKETMAAEQYYEDLLAGRIRDPTVSMQINAGFEPRGLLANYLNDPVCDNYSVLLVLDAAKDVRGASREKAMSYIRINTEIPGPKAKQMLARRAAALPSGLGRATDVVVERAEGALVFDVDGNTLIDLAGGIGMLAVGHSPAPVVDAIQRQAEKFIHPCALVTTFEPYVALAEIVERNHARNICEENVAGEQRGRERGKRGEAGAQVHRTIHRNLLRRRLSRPDLAHVEPHQQVRALQVRVWPVRSRDCAAAHPEHLSHARRHDRGRVRRLRHPATGAGDGHAS